MSLSEEAGPRRPRQPPALAGHALAIVAVAAATLAAVLMDAQVTVPNLSLVFVLPVVLAAVAFGWGPALTAAVGGALAYNYFLIEPRYTLRVADPANVWALILLLTTAGVVSAVASEGRRRALEAWAAADQAAAIRGLARGLVGETTREGVTRRCAEALAQLFQAPAVVLVMDGDVLTPVAAAGGARLTDADQEAAAWSLAAGIATRGGAYPAGAATFDFWPLTTPQRQQAVVGVRISDDERGRPSAPERLVETVVGYLSVALDREAYARQALETRVQAASERLKADLLAAVSHDLKTPLSTILFTLQSLQRFAGGHDEATRAQLLAAAETETARLSRMVENLLDMNRLEAGALPVRPAPTDAGALVKAALERAAPALAGRKVVRKSGARARFLVDPALFESALANLLENAGKYSPPGSTVRVQSGRDGDMGWVEVLDEGPGFDGSPEPMFERFARGQAGDGRPPGTGLGLSIARGFLEAQGGRVEACNRPDGPGACVRLLAPLAQPL
jgi:two-component system sensor histidine kinase KdpD